LVFGLLLAACPCLAQLATTGQDANGVAAAWDVKTQMDELAKDVRRLTPLLAHVRPDNWVAEGASPTYVEQAQSAKNNLNVSITATQLLSKEPERLLLGLKAYLQLEKMEALMESLRDGVRRYQSPDLANMLAAVSAGNQVHRQRLAEHLLDIAEMREAEFSVANAEAQRCRAELSRAAATKSNPGKGKTSK
jgi:hypothetical protein